MDIEETRGRSGSAYQLYQSLVKRSFSFSAPNTNEITSFAGFAMIINIVLGTGPFTVPYFVFKAGVFLSPILLLISMLLAYSSATFVIESLSICNAIETYSLEKQKSGEQMIEMQGIFSLKKAYEFTKMSAIMLGTVGKFFTLLIIYVFLFGSVSIKCVAAADSLAGSLNYLFYNNGTGLNDYLGFDVFYIVLTIFNLLVLFICLGDVSKTAALNQIIVIFRFLTIFLLVGGAIYSIYVNGAADFEKVPKAEFTAIPEVFSTFIFFYLMHHGLPGIVRPMRPETQVKSVLIVSYLSSIIVLVSIGLTGVFAFSQFQNSCSTGFPCKIEPLYNKNFLGLPFLGQLVNLYPVLNIAPTPVLVMIMRNNLVNLILPKQKLDEMKPSVKFGTTLLAFLPSIVACYVLRTKIASMISLTGYFGGLFLVFLFPCLMIWKARNLKLEILGSIFNFHASPFQNKVWIFCIVSIPFLMAIYKVITLLS